MCWQIRPWYRNICDPLWFINWMHGSHGNKTVLRAKHRSPVLEIKFNPWFLMWDMIIIKVKVDGITERNFWNVTQWNKNILYACVFSLILKSISICKRSCQFKNNTNNCLVFQYVCLSIFMLNFVSLTSAADKLKEVTKS